MNKIIQKLIVFSIVLSAGLFGAHSAFAAGPTMIANGASNITQTQADLTGFFTAKVPLTDVWFDYGPTPIPALSTPHQSMGKLLNGSFSATVTNLIPNTVYYFRSYGINANGTGFSSLLTFTTLPYKAPIVITTPATNITANDATLNASFNGNGNAVDTWFEYATNANLGNAKKTTVITQGAVSGTASDTISGLAANTKYYFRAVAKSIGGTTRATSILNFTTTATAPKVCTIANFSASALSVNKGTAVTLDWASTNCTTATLTSASVQVSSVGVSTNGTKIVTPVLTTTYTLSATDSVSGTIDTKSLTVTVSQTAQSCTISNFSSSLQTIIKGNSATLNWNTSNCTSASISPFGSVSTSGSLVVTPSTTTTYTLTAVGNTTAVLSFTVVVTNGGNGYQSPTLITNAPTNVSTNSATLQGTLNGNGYATTAWIEFPCGNNGNRFSTQSTSGYANISAVINNLAPNTTYCYQVVGRDVNNTPVYGNQYTFSTYGTGGGSGGPFTKPGGGSTIYPPVATTYSAQGVTDTLAVLTGYVNGNGGFTNAWFEYGTSNSLGYTTVTQSYNPSGNISININGLLPNTTYYYRLVTRNSAGMSYGTILSFTTTGWFGDKSGNANTLKAVTTLVSKVTTTTATLNGIIYKGSNGTTHASFEYGTNVAALGIKTMKYPLSAGSSTKFASAISGLSPDTIYYFRVIAENNGTVSKGDIFYFKTNKVGAKTTTTVVGSTKNGTPKNTDSETGSGISVGDTTGTNLSAGAGSTGKFFPTTFIGWLILTLIILLIVIIIRLLVSRRHNQHPPAH